MSVTMNATWPLPGLKGIRVAAHPARAPVLQQLDVVAGPAVAGRRHPGDQLEAQEIAVERDRAVQIADGEPGVQDRGDAHRSAI